MACTHSACAIIKSNVAYVEWYVHVPHTMSTHITQVFGTKFLHLLLGFASRTRPSRRMHMKLLHLRSSPFHGKFIVGMWLRENFPKLCALHPLQEFHVFAAAKSPHRGKKTVVSSWRQTNVPPKDQVANICNGLCLLQRHKLTKNIADICVGQNLAQRQFFYTNFTWAKSCRKCSSFLKKLWLL